MFSNFLDIVFIIATALSLAAGLYAGAVRLIIGFVMFLLSFVFAYFIATPLNDVVHEYISNHLLVVVISDLLAYLICAIFCAILATKLKKLVEDISGGAVDRLLGFSLGAIRGFLISLVIFTMVNIFVTKSYSTSKNLFELLEYNPKAEMPHWVSDSRLSKELRMILTSVISLIGKDQLKQIEIPHYEISDAPEKKKLDDKKDTGKLRQKTSDKKDDAL